MTEKQKIDELLERGVAEVIHADLLRSKLNTGKPLRVKFGIDPTSPHIHLGRATAIWKLRELQDLGHQVVFIVGDFTGVIGDTSDKESERPMLTREAVEQNLATYFEQAGKILDMSKVEKHYNSEWLEKLGYREIGEHADAFSLSDFISRENIKRRLDAGKRVSLRELLYPLMQGYDSVAVKADIEIGGSDQKFNMLSGRKLQERFGQAPQDIIMLDLIEGLDGRKMSSSFGNTINVTDTANDMFGKVMSLRDELIMKYFMYATRVSAERMKEIEAGLNAGANPRDAKLDLAEEIATLYHGRDEAVRAREAFIATFQKKEIPDDMVEVSAEKDESLVDVLLRNEVVTSKTDWRRLVEEGAVKKLDGGEEKIEDTKILATPGVYKIGKRRFVKLNIS
ncbi:MAG: tyrosine--tRNA ligase [Candidatus Yonathbacteria bacterium RIFCSPLOWO2_01_FULL_47_33b]|uniref:Tyrosine--tRNA ligase n=1 Tax=Candidatus Yonathbacteria bacterium RIFCSPLOWO2_01_FULL_47_33b TaxID=1802727 RepID=A0A1G2SGS0_9BACT|nr:MAG: tyrosine--tRNA ligase [Candidatus Yonathbacteria bacterium RIFCSPLOWO2_01_FULL_47_33b]